MKVLRYALMLGCCLIGVARAEELPQAMPKDVGLAADKLSGIKSVVQAALDKKQTAGVVVLVSRHGKVAYLEAFGKMSADAEKPMTPDAIFRIYSMSKPITSVAVLILNEEGKLKLDDPVAKYLPEFKGLRVYAGKGDETVEAKREMTVRDLLRHTSGLTYGAFGNSPVDKMYTDQRILGSGTLADMVGKLGKLPLVYQPGTRFNYSVSTDVLGRIVEVVSGKKFDEFLQERIFKPLDMRDTGFSVPADKLVRFTAHHRAGESGSLKVSDNPATSRYRLAPTFLSGGGGLVSTARDYARFAQMLLNGGELSGTRVLRAETVREMTMNQLPAEALPLSVAGIAQPGIGFGLGVSVRLDGNTTNHGAGEYGWSGLASTYFWVAPKDDLVVVVLQQVEPFNFALQLALKPLIYAAIAQ